MLWTMKYVANRMNTKGLSVDLLSDNSNSVLNVTSVSTRVLHSLVTVCDGIKYVLPHFIWLPGCKTCHVCLQSSSEVRYLLMMQVLWPWTTGSRKDGTFLRST